jgi:hypothetical protein
MNIRIKSIVVISVLLLAASSLSVRGADGDDSPAMREAAARHYLNAVPVQKMIDEMLNGIIKSIPAEHQAGFNALIRKTLRADFIEQASIKAMVSTFTVREINAMTTFYHSPEGRSIQDKMGIYMAEIMPVVQQEMIRALQEMKTEKDVQQIKNGSEKNSMK